MKQYALWIGLMFAVAASLILAGVVFAQEKFPPTTPPAAKSGSGAAKAQAMNVPPTNPPKETPNDQALKATPASKPPVDPDPAKPGEGDGGIKKGSLSTAPSDRKTNAKIDDLKQSGPGAKAPAGKSIQKPEADPISTPGHSITQTLTK